MRIESAQLPGPAMPAWPPVPWTHIATRDGIPVRFDPARIRSAIHRAGVASGSGASGSGASGSGASGGFAEDVAARITVAVLDVLATRFPDAPPPIEDIQDEVEWALMRCGQHRAARAYIVYRAQHARLRQGRHAVVDAVTSIDEYLDRQDWRVQANANQGYSLGGLILNSAGKLIANYWLNSVYPVEIGAAHRDGSLHIHDLDMLSGYCAGWSLRTLLVEGFNGVSGKIEAAPPRHLRSAVGQMVNFLGTLQNEWAGAQAFSSFDTYLAPFLRKDRLSYAEVRQTMQEFIFNLNVPSRWGSQPPFTNLTFDWVCPEDLRAQHPIIGGEEMAFRYGDLQEEMDAINRAYIEVMQEGDARGRVFTFPIPTYNITEDFPWHSENAERLFAMTAKFGLPYFQNFLNSDLKPNMVRSMCCRLQLDLRELLKRGNGLFGSAEQTGSLGVVTVNCARLGFLHRGDADGLYARLDTLLDLARDSLEIKRKVIQRHMDDGLFPYTKRYLGTLRNHFSTIGVNGINEMIRNFTADETDITSAEGHRLACEMLDHVRGRITEFQEQTGHMYNLEATPAEGATYRFAREDRRRHPGILQAGTSEKPFYTNSSQLPVGHTDDPFAALEHQEALQRRYTGGTVLHLYLGERLPSADACRELVRRSLTRFRLPYITVTPTFSVCPVHGYLAGEQNFCPVCDEERLASKRQLCCN